MKNRPVLLVSLGALLIPLFFIVMAFVAKRVNTDKHRTNIENLALGKGSYEEQRVMIEELREALKWHIVTSEQLDVAQTSFSEDEPIKWIGSLDTLSKYREAKRHYDELKKMALHAIEIGGQLSFEDMLIATDHANTVEQFHEYFFGLNSPVSFRSFVYTSPSGERKMCLMEEIGTPLSDHKKMLHTCATGISWTKDFTSGP